MLTNQMLRHSLGLIILSVLGESAKEYLKPSNLLPDLDNCGIQDSDRIVGGSKTELEEFPWLALLEYQYRSGNKQHGCGGSLINHKYVLTAAHCAGDENEKMINVRLGEWNIDTEEDCIVINEYKDCTDPPVDIPVESVIVYPQYNAKDRNVYHDIALVRMKRNIEFSSFIRPICLPFDADTIAPGDKLWVSGWGKTKTAYHSDIKLKVQLPVVSTQQCRTVYSNLNITLKGNQFCAGGEKNKDSCSGDSGGPLMQTTKSGIHHYIVYGIVSFGIDKCGTEGWPGVYTKVSKYLDWINKSIRA